MSIQQSTSNRHVFRKTDIAAWFGALLVPTVLSILSVIYIWPQLKAALNASTVFVCNLTLDGQRVIHDEYGHFVIVSDKICEPSFGNESHSQLLQSVIFMLAIGCVVALVVTATRFNQKYMVFDRDNGFTRYDTAWTVAGGVIASLLVLGIAAVLLTLTYVTVLAL